jgi:hypothetical protein
MMMEKEEIVSELEFWKEMNCRRGKGNGFQDGGIKEYVCVSV